MHLVCTLSLNTLKLKKVFSKHHHFHHSHIYFQLTTSTDIRFFGFLQALLYFYLPLQNFFEFAKTYFDSTKTNTNVKIVVFYSSNQQNRHNRQIDTIEIENDFYVMKKPEVKQTL